MSDKPKTRKTIMRDLVAKCREELCADGVVLIITGSHKRRTYTEHVLDGNAHACRGALQLAYMIECEPEEEDEEESDDEEDDDQRPETHTKGESE